MPKLDMPYTPPKDETPLPYELDHSFYYNRQDDFSGLGIWENDYGLIANLHRTYMLDENGDLVSAYEKKPLAVMGSAIRSGLFTLDKDGHMRQITLSQNSFGWDFNVSVPMELPKNPPKPSLITRLFAWLVPSWGAEVRDYKRQVAFNAKLSEFGKHPDHPVSFDPNTPLPKAEEPETENTPEPEPEPKEKTREEILRTQLKPTDELLSREEFRKYLNTAYNTSLYEDLDVLQGKNPTAEKYLEALARRVEYVAISEIYGEHNGSPDREYVYDNHQRGYWAMKAFLKDYVRQKVDMQKLDEILETGYENSPHKQYFDDLHEFMFNRYLRNNALAEVKDILQTGQVKESSTFQVTQPANSRTKEQEQLKPVETVPPPPEEVEVNEQETQPEPETQPESEIRPEQQEETKEVPLPIVERPASEREFTGDKEFLEDHEDIALSNDPMVLHNFLNDPDNDDLRNDTREHIAHRLYHLVNMAEQAKTPAQSDRKPIIDTNANGERRIMLDAGQTRPQKTVAGCWSVSLQTQLNYRGVKNIDQEDIRAYRPDKTKQSIEFDLNATRLNKDDVNSVNNYSTLINQFLPNTALHSIGWDDLTYSLTSADDREKVLREVISKGLAEHNSPISFISNGHYWTIVGMEGDMVYYKDPMSGKDGRGDPNATYKRTIKQLANRGATQLSWLQDLEVDLGGSVKDLNGNAGGGVNYSGGVYSDASEEVVEYNKTHTIREANQTYKAAGSTQPLRMISNYPVTLGYKRNPGQKTGFAYNMDALEKMRLELKELSNAGKARGGADKTYASLDALTEKLDGFVSGREKIDYEKMYGVAKDYKALADNAAKGTFGDDGALSNALGKHLRQVRGALDAHLHYDNRQLGHPKRWPDPGSNLHRKLEQGLAGMIVASGIKHVGMNEENWLKGYDLKNITIARDQILHDSAFQNMMTKLDLAFERDHDLPPEDRSSVQLCQSACGGDSRALLNAYNKELLAQNKRQQTGVRQENVLEDAKVAAGEDGPQKNNGNVNPIQF